jgi:hypothetical protein
MAMKSLALADLLAAALILSAGLARADDSSCKFDSVAMVLGIDGDRPAQIVRKDGKAEPATEGACINHGERLEAGVGVVVDLRTGQGERHVGGPYDPVFQAPLGPANGESPSASAYLETLFRGLLSHGGQPTPATGRESKRCSPANEAPQPLAPLSRLQQSHQKIGADLTTIIAAWKPSSAPHSVHVALNDPRGGLIAEAQTCRNAHVELSPLQGRLHLGDRLTLVIADAGDKILYELSVVDPKDLPAPPVALSVPWLDAAWRLAAGPPDVLLDSLSRLQTAPADALGARSLSDAVWSDSSF